jgi:hypothetical protein
MLVPCIILLRYHICMEVSKPCANCEPICGLENFQWGRELCFAGAVILVDGCLAQILRWASISQYTPNECFMEGQVNVSA